LDINKIFGAFDSSSRDDDDFPQVSFLYNAKISDENHPRYFIKMFTKIILNNIGFSKQLANFFGSADPQINLIDVQEAGEMMLYNRALKYLEQIDVQDKYHVRILFEEATPKLESALNKSLSYFEREEEYEKCIIIKKYLDFLNFSS